MRMKIILNPTAGRGKGKNAQQIIEDVLRESFVEYDIELTKGPGLALELAKKAVKDGYNTVVAAGGDGTVNQVLNGLAESGIPMAVLPCGTGNDFAAMLGMPKDLKESMQQILNGSIGQVDLCKVNDHYFISSVGVGFDGQVAHTVNNSFPYLRGMIVYILGVLKTIFSYRGHHLRITIDGKTTELDALLVAIANSKSYGGGLKIAPDALINDGLLDICTAKMMKPLEILLSLPKLVKGTHGALKKIRFYKGKSISLESDTPLYYQVDGEVFKGTSLNIQLISQSFAIMGAAIESVQQRDLAVAATEE